MSIEEMADGDNVTRRDVLRKTATGAGIGAAAAAAPSIAGLSVAPLFASAQSCVPNLTTLLSYRFQAEGVDVTFTIFGQVVDDGNGTCTITFEMPGNPDLAPQMIQLKLTMSSGEVFFTSEYDAEAGGRAIGTFACERGTPISVAGLSPVFAGAALPVFTVVSQDKILVC